MAGASLKQRIAYWIEEVGQTTETNAQIADRFEVAQSNYVSNKVSALVNEGVIVREVISIPGQGDKRILKHPSIID